MCQEKLNKTSLVTLVFGLYFEFKTRNTTFVEFLFVGGGSFQDFALLRLRLYTDFQLNVYPGTGLWLWWVWVLFSVLLWSEPFSFKLKFWTWTKTNTKSDQ